MGRWSTLGFVGAMAVAAACSSDTGSGGANDAGANDAGANDAGANDATGDGGSCPDQKPSDGAACSGSSSCQYGQSTCCGMQYSLFTCRCQAGGFSCSMTVECNFTCPDASAD
jgi:hypothetical protein